MKLTINKSRFKLLTENKKCSENIEVEVPLQIKTTYPMRQEQVIVPDDAYAGLKKVTVETIPDSFIIPAGQKEITRNGTHDVGDYAYAIVNVPSSEGETDISSLKFKEGVYIGYYKQTNYIGESTSSVIYNVSANDFYLIKIGDVVNGKLNIKYINHFDTIQSSYLSFIPYLNQGVNLCYLDSDDNVYTNGTILITSDGVMTVAPIKSISSKLNVVIDNVIYAIAYTGDTYTYVSGGEDDNGSIYGYSTIAPFYSPQYTDIFTNSKNITDVLTDNGGVDSLITDPIMTSLSYDCYLLNFYRSPGTSKAWRCNRQSDSFYLLSSEYLDESDLPFLVFYTSSGGGGGSD